MQKLWAETLIEDMTDKERTHAEKLEKVAAKIAQNAGEADISGRFYHENIDYLRSENLTGLVVPEEYGGLGGSLRDLCAATYTLGGACPSLALAFFFHSSTSSRGLLALEAIDENLFSQEEIPKVQDFAHKVLFRMGQEKLWFGNFASESAKSESSMIKISTKAKKVEGGYQLNGTKAYGCSTGVADYYLVTALLSDYKDANGISLFFVAKNSKGVGEREPWDALGMRATATQGITLSNVFVSDEEALAMPGSFNKLMKMSRGSFVGNQIAGTAVYLGAARRLYEDTLATLMGRTFEDSKRSIASSPMHQELIGRMTVHLETAHLWTRRQLQLESSNPPLYSKDQVIMNWRLCKGVVTDAAFELAIDALKASGTSGTKNTSSQARGVRNLAMGLVQAFPSERGRLEVAKMIVSQKSSPSFGA